MTDLWQVKEWKTFRISRKIKWEIPLRRWNVLKHKKEGDNHIKKSEWDEERGAHCSPIYCGLMLEGNNQVKIETIKKDKEWTIKKNVIKLRKEKFSSQNRVFKKRSNNFSFIIIFFILLFFILLSTMIPAAYINSNNN